MIPFIPQTNHVNDDRMYYTDSQHFIKADRNFGRGRHEADILTLLHDAWYAPKLVATFEKDGPGIGNPTKYFCIRMEYRKGETLENLKGSLDYREKLAIIQWLFTIFNDLSARGIVHGDLNDSNVLFDRESQRVALIDWEMARAEESLIDVYGAPYGILSLLESLR
jgi:aminoglycoside phosphotransferase (APT) family kinase protein